MSASLCSICFLLAGSAFADASNDKSTPITLNTRLNMAWFGDSELAKAHINLAAPDFMANYFFSPYQSIGLGLDAYVSVSSLDLWAWRFAYKFFFIGDGYPLISKADQFKVEQFSRYAFYSGAEIKNYNYFISSEQKKKITINNENIDSTGNYYNINALVGFEFRFNNHYALNLEASHALFDIASTDDRFSTKASIILAGLTIKL